MTNQSLPLFRRLRAKFVWGFWVLHVRRLRRLCALYAVAFFLAASAAPHRHVNGLEDLLSVRPSDSGVIAERLGHSADCQSGIHAVRLVDDDPCLSCFHNDLSIAAATPSYVIRETPTVLDRLRVFRLRTFLEPAADHSSSRSPPLAA